jgi:hypothetical protein
VKAWQRPSPAIYGIILGLLAIPAVGLVVILEG